MSWVISAFLIVHGVLNVLIWGLPSSTDAPFDAHKSPFVGDARIWSTLLAAVAGTALIAAGIAYLTGADWWWTAAVGGASLSAVVMLLTFTPWWSLGLLINVAIVVLTLRSRAATS